MRLLVRNDDVLGHGAEAAGAHGEGAALARSQLTVSHHTSVLVEAGLLRGRKDGRWTWWSLVPGRLAQVRAALGD